MHTIYMIGKRMKKKKRNPTMSKIKNSSSSTGEAIMICIDTSIWMENKESPRFKQQAEAIKLYCTHKFKTNRQTVIGIAGMGERCVKNLITPTRNIARIMRSLYDAKIFGDLLIIDGVVHAHYVWLDCKGQELGKHLPKRMVVFAGGPVYYEKDDMKELGEALKVKNVACDAISFGDPELNKKELFDTLIAAADVNGNCNCVHVPPDSTVLEALWSSPIIQRGDSASLASLSVQDESYSVADDTDALALSRSLITPRVGVSVPLASLWEQWESSSELNAKAVAASYPDSVNPNDHPNDSENAEPNWEPETPGSLWERQVSSKLNAKAAAASYPDSVDPHDHPVKIDASSQSSLDLKLENATPNWQPETLDQKIERLERELQSLILQKNQQVAC